MLESFATRCQTTKTGWKRSLVDEAKTSLSWSWDARAVHANPLLSNKDFCVLFFLPHSNWSGVRTGHSSRLTIFKSETVCTDRRAPKSMWLVRNRLKLKGLGAEKHVVSEERAQVEGAGGREEKKQPLPQFLNSITQLENWMAGVPESPPDPLSPKTSGSRASWELKEEEGRGTGLGLEAGAVRVGIGECLCNPVSFFLPFISSCRPSPSKCSTQHSAGGSGALLSICCLKLAD